MADDDLVAAMARLIPQLSSSNPPPDAADLEAIVASDASVLLLAVDDGEVVGSLTLALFRIPTGLRSWIEDVVVDGSSRGRGVGEALNLAALDRARAEGATTVDLTSQLGENPIPPAPQAEEGRAQTHATDEPK